MLETVRVSHRTANPDLFPTDDLLDGGFNPLSINRHWNVGNCENELGDVSRRQGLSNSRLDRRSDVLKAEARFHHYEQEDLLVKICWSPSSNAEAVRDVVGEGCGLNDVVYLTTSEADS